MSTILLRNPELHFKNQLDLDQLVDEAYHTFCKVLRKLNLCYVGNNYLRNFQDQGIAVGCDRQAFYSAAPNLTTGHLARATVNSVLRLGELDTSAADQIDEDDSCRVS